MAERRLHEPNELRVERRVELAIDLRGDEVLVEQRRDASGSEKLSRCITWHQWHAK